MYEIAPAKISKASCHHNHSCLETGKCGTRKMCEVSSELVMDAVVLKTNKPAACNNRRAVGDNYQICECPVRCAIYRKYGV